MTFVSDLVWALRGWRRRPALPLTSIAFLGGSLGAVVGIFTVADAAIWRPLPLPDVQRLVWVQSVDRGEGGDSSPGLVQSWRARAHTVDRMGAIRPLQGTWRDRAGTDRLDGAQATPDTLPALGLQALRGRLFDDEDARAGAPGVVVVTHRLWQARFGAAPDAVGMPIEIDGRARTIVGVLAPQADALPFGGDWWVPLALSAAEPLDGPRYLDVVARLAEGRSISEAAEELTAIAASAGARGADGSALSARVRLVGDAFADRSARVLQPLLAASLLVLLIAAANVANLRLADHVHRRGEIALRAALGANRGRLVAQLFADALLISVAAGAVGLIVAQWCAAGLQALLPPQILGPASAALDTRAAFLMLVLVLAVTALSGVLPALRQTRGPLAGGMLTPARTVVGGDARLRSWFVIAQIAVAMTLGAAGGTMLQTSVRLADAAQGYASDRVWTAALRLSGADFPTASAIDAVATRIIDRVAGLPGVEGAAVASRVPLAGGAPGSDVALWTDPFTTGTDRQVRIRLISPGYFDLIGAGPIEGRDIARTDAAGTEPVVLVNQSLAERLKPGRSPVGAFVKFAVQDFNGPTPTAWRVVGLVADAKDRGPRQPAEPEVYLAIAQVPPGVFEWIGRQLLLVARTAPEATLSPGVLRSAVNAVDNRVPAFDVQTLEARFSAHVSSERLLTGLLIPLGVIGLLVAGVGIFAVVMHDVHRRRRELALRMVLGASPGSIIRKTGAGGLRLGLTGSSLGAIGAFLSGRMLASVTFGAGTLDPAVIAGSLSLVGITVAAAVWIPAMRATHQDPASVLRAE